MTTKDKMIFIILKLIEKLYQDVKVLELKSEEDLNFERNLFCENIDKSNSDEELLNILIT